MPFALRFDFLRFYTTRVKSGKTRTEQMFSASPPEGDVPACPRALGLATSCDLVDVGHELISGCTMVSFGAISASRRACASAVRASVRRRGVILGGDRDVA